MTTTSKNASSPKGTTDPRRLAKEERIAKLILMLQENEKLPYEQRTSPSEMADKLGISSATMYNTKNGYLSEAAKRLGVSRDSLLVKEYGAKSPTIYAVREISKKDSIKKTVPKATTPTQKMQDAASIAQLERAETSELNAQAVSAFQEMLNQFADAEAAFKALQGMERVYTEAALQATMYIHALSKSRVAMRVSDNLKEISEDHRAYFIKKLQEIRKLKAQCPKLFTTEKRCADDCCMLRTADFISDEERIATMTAICFSPEENGFTKEFSQAAMQLSTEDFKKLIAIVCVSKKEASERGVEWKFENHSELTDVLEMGGFKFYL